jgi:hydroxypyruvate reductase
MGLREDASTIYETAIRDAQPDAAVRRALEGRDFGSGRVLLVAGGKAAWQMAFSAAGLLGDRIGDGIVITKYGHAKGPLGRLRIREAGIRCPTPIPSPPPRRRWRW